MSKMIDISAPLSEELVRTLNAGDEVLVNGVIYTARDIAHQRLCSLIDNSQPLPIDLNGAIIYFVGPTPATKGRAIGAAGPTTSSRMDRFSPTLIKHGLKAMIVKGYRDSNVVGALKQYGAVHLATIGGAGALLSKHIVSSEIIAYEDLGTEAIRKLVVKDFPAIVAYDTKGNCVYDIQ